VAVTASRITVRRVLFGRFIMGAYLMAGLVDGLAALLDKDY
jgi:hypothetical protein